MEASFWVIFIPVTIVLFGFVVLFQYHNSVHFIPMVRGHLFTRNFRYFLEAWFHKQKEVHSIAGPNRFLEKTV